MLSIARSAQEAHRRYVSTGQVPVELLREGTRRAWERAHLLGANARLPKAEHAGGAETERLLEQEAWLLEAARPYLRLLSRAAGGERHAAMLGDARGVVLDTLGDEWTLHGPEPFPSAGALLDESVAGSNGIGTPLADDGYAELVGPEHFIEGFHPFTCQGIPIHDPAGRLAGVVSVSVRRPEAATRLKEILICAAKGVEAELLRRRLERDVQQVVASAGIDAQLVEKLRQDVVQAQAAARVRAEAAARGLAKNRLTESVRLLALAERSIGRFRRQAEIWRALASSEPGPVSAVAAHELVATLGELLATEATTRRIELSIEAPEPLFVRARAMDLARTLLRALLLAFDHASGGGAVRVRACRTLPVGVEIYVDATPPFGRGGTVVPPFRLTLSPAEPCTA